MSKARAVKARKIYWDTYRSWVDRLEEKENKFLLFQRPRSASKIVSNFNGYGMMPYDQDGEVVGIGAQIIRARGKTHPL